MLPKADDPPGVVVPVTLVGLVRPVPRALCKREGFGVEGVLGTILDPFTPPPAEVPELANEEAHGLATPNAPEPNKEEFDIGAML